MMYIICNLKILVANLACVFTSKYSVFKKIFIKEEYNMNVVYNISKNALYNNINNLHNLYGRS